MNKTREDLLKEIDSLTLENKYLKDRIKILERLKTSSEVSEKRKWSSKRQIKSIFKDTLIGGQDEG